MGYSVIPYVLKNHTRILVMDKGDSGVIQKRLKNSPVVLNLDWKYHCEVMKCFILKNRFPSSLHYKRPEILTNPSNSIRDCGYEMPFSTKRKPGLLEEMTDSKSVAKIILEHFVISDSKKSVKDNLGYVKVT